MKRSLHVAFIAVALLLPFGCASVPQHTAPITQSTVQPVLPADTVSISVDGTRWGPDDRLPFDPSILVDTLENGVRLYVRRNERPETRAELRLVVDAGSVLEDEDQRGLAHFVEHMAFNGTERFEKQELIDYMERHGMRFGADLNAYTSFDETVYMLTVPTDTLEVIGQGIRILRDWAGSVSFEEEEIDKERGVVTEEWRLRRGAQARMLDEQLPILLKGSKHAERLPIGDPDVIRNADYDVVKRFYEDWYRPGLMAVIAIGDFDPEVVLGMMRDEFETLSLKPSPRTRLEHTVPGHPETLIAPATDPEAPYGTVRIVFKREQDHEGTVASYRDDLVQGLYHAMFNERLGELMQDTDPPFTFAGSGAGGFVRGAEFYTLQALVRESGAARALEVLLREAERVRRHGFTEGELTRSKQNVLRYYERAYAERDKSESDQFAAEYARNYLEDEPVPGIAFEYRMVEQLLPTITVDEINALSNRLITRDSRVVLLDGPDSFPLPDSAAVIAVFGKVREMGIAPYDDLVSDQPLVPETPSAGSVVTETYNDSLDVYRWQLSNGAEVIVKPTDFKNDEIVFRASSVGGSSVYPDSVFLETSLASTVIGQSGLGEFGPIELQKKLSGKIASVSAGITPTREQLSGFASNKDLETLFQLIYLNFTGPRADEVAFQSYKVRMKELLASSRNAPERAFQDTIQVTMSQGHVRSKPMDEAALEAQDLESSLEVFKDRFSDASDFTFYFVGSFTLDEIRPLVEQYIASIPDKERDESWRDVTSTPPEGIVNKVLRRGIEPKARVHLEFSGTFDWSRRNRQMMNALVEVSRLKFREVLREDLGGTYGVSVSGPIGFEPKQRYRFVISFGCDPVRVDELVEQTFLQIDSLRAFGADETYLEKLRETDSRTWEESLKENRFWLNSLYFTDLYGENPGNILKGSKQFMAELTPDQIRQAAQAYLDTDQYALFILLPEDKSE